MAISASATRKAALLDIHGAAKHLSVSERYVRRLVNERRIRHHKVGHFVRFDVADLDSFIEVREIASSVGAR